MIAVWKGRVPYEAALDAQRVWREGLIAGEVGEELWLLEHPPVITTGRRAVADLDAERVAAAGYALVATERGGLATCHEPGQLVGYLLSDARLLGVRRTVAALEAGIIGWLQARGIPAGRRGEFPGVWVGTDKIAAIGLHFKLGRSMHGFALNLTNDGRGFGLITPCGITDGGVTTLGRLLAPAAAPGPAEAAPEVGETLVRALLDARSGIH